MLTVSIVSKMGFVLVLITGNRFKYRTLYDQIVDSTLHGEHYVEKKGEIFIQIRVREAVTDENPSPSS